MDQMIKDVRALATTEGRGAGSIGNVKAREHIVERLQEVGIQKYLGSLNELPYEWSRDGSVNIVGQKIALHDVVLPESRLGWAKLCGPFDTTKPAPALLNPGHKST